MELSRHSRTFLRRLLGQTDLLITMADYQESRRYISIMMIAQGTADRWLQMLRERLTPNGLLSNSSILETHNLSPSILHSCLETLLETRARFSRHYELLIRQCSLLECPRLPL